MKKKKLILFTNDTIVRKINADELKKFFENTIEIEAYSMDDPVEEKSIEGDLVLTISPMDITKIKKYLKEDIEIIQGTRTILYESYKKLKALPKNTKAMVISTNKMLAFDLTSILLKMGINHIDFYPVYDGIEKIPDTDIAIIPLELNLNLKLDIDKEKIINLNSRRITVETYKAIMIIFNVINPKLNKKLKEYSKRLVNTEMSDIPLSKICALESILNTTMNEIDDGIIIINKFNKIIYINNSLMHMLGIDINNIELGYLDEKILPRPIYKELEVNEDIEHKLLNIKEIDKNFLISKKNIELSQNNLGSIIILKDVTKIEKFETQLRGMIVKKGYVAKYTFADIKGNSDTLAKCIEKAKRISLVDRTTLVIGESGTGKEMFVQAIHNNSNRKSNPFVAINCAALSSELLESELFGYEEGSFTGAIKGGKKGLFELAHRGTLFLDEIGDISLDMQVKLLRVIQEQEVRRIGGDNIISIDVRIIAATNCNLEKLVDEGKFRLDLYYRLNTFTLFIPPLRERRVDLGIITKNILEEIGFHNKTIDSSLMEILYNNKWKGNIRELKNCIEYMAYMGGEVLYKEDLPDNFNIHSYEKERHIRNSYLDGFINKEKKLIIFILNMLKNRQSGRRLLLKLCMENGYNVSEYKLRNILDYLNKNGYIEYGKGRAGAKTTPKGELLVSSGMEL